MKKIIICLLFGLTPAAILLAQVPAAVSQAFQAQHAKVKNPEWEREGNHYVAEWEENGQEIEAVYDAQGHALATVREMSVESLPTAVLNGFEGQFPGMIAREADRIEWATGVVQYEIEFISDGHEHEALFDAEGAYLGDGDDDHEEEDDEEDDD